MTRSPNSCAEPAELGHATLRAGPAGSASGNGCWHGGVPVGESSSVHQLVTAGPEGEPSGV